ncbi:MAG: hypothetical protein ABJB86_13030 [Bacteroidota bacterium]
MIKIIAMLSWPLESPLVFIAVTFYSGNDAYIEFKSEPDFSISFTIFIATYVLAVYDVLSLAIRKAIRFNFFNKFILMSVVTIGAFAIGSYWLPNLFPQSFELQPVHNYHES